MEEMGLGRGGRGLRAAVACLHLLGGEGRGLISSDNMSLSDRCRNNKR